MTHPLQTAWYDAEIEASYLRTVEAMVHSGDLDIAAEKILGDLDEIDTPVADMCRALSEHGVELSGWEEIGDNIAQFEGEQITAVHIVMSNETDLVFEDKSLTHDPMVEIAFYCDEICPFSGLSPDELLKESLRENPEWFGQSEDIEVYLEANGLGPLNTALLRHKRQYYFRDAPHTLDTAQGLPSDIVPLAYIEFRLAAMYRAILFHQAVRDLLDGYGLYGQIPVIVGMVNMKVEIGSVYTPKEAKVVQHAKVAKLSVTIKRNLEEDVTNVTGTSIRQNLSDEPVAKLGFFRRLFASRKAA